MQLAEDTPLEFLVLVIRSLCYKAPQELFYTKALLLKQRDIADLPDM